MVDASMAGNAGPGNVGLFWRMTSELYGTVLIRNVVAIVNYTTYPNLVRLFLSRYCASLVLASP